MLFSSSIFLFGFLPLSLIGYYLIPKKFRKARNFFLLFISLFFYAWGEPVFVLLMLTSIIVNYIFGLLVENFFENKKLNKLILFLMLFFNLSLLFLFKYSNFFVDNLNKIFNFNLKFPQLSLPIGISFFTFQAISYVIDVYRRTDIDGDIIKAQKNPINVGLYISLFPQLIAGPIVRYKTVAEQINKRTENFSDFSEGVRRFIIGISKKVIISNNLALIADYAFSLPSTELSLSFAWLGAISYSLQIFFDFSGYSDMAIGLGKIFGFHFLENFNYPYISKSISEFWRRWHISLGSWFKDYVYFPLGGSKKGKSRTILNLLIVWFLTGFWHGANWTYIAWGLYFFIFISLEKLFANSKFILFKFNFIKHSYTLIVVILGWVLFRADSLKDALIYIKIMLGLSNNIAFDNLTILYLNENIFFLLIAIIFSMPIVDFLKNKFNLIARKGLLKSPLVIDLIYPLIHTVIYTFVFMITLSYIVKGAYNPFIYFNF